MEQIKETLQELKENGFKGFVKVGELKRDYRNREIHNRVQLPCTFPVEQEVMLRLRKPFENWHFLLAVRLPKHLIQVTVHLAVAMAD